MASTQDTTKAVHRYGKTGKGELLYTGIGILFPEVALVAGFIDLIWGNDIFNDGN